MSVKTNIKNLPLLAKKVDGISLWRINMLLKKLSRSKLALEEQIKDQCIVVFLPSKTERVPTSVKVKHELLKEIESLDGFETLRVSILENCKPVYKEQLTHYGVYRWIEIPVPETKQLEYSISDVKDKLIENYSITNIQSESNTIPLS